MARLFGVEIEFVFGNGTRGDGAEIVCAELERRGILVQNCIRQHFGFSRTHWQLKYDGSVSRGAELVSPPLDFDDPAQRAQVTTAAEALQAVGCNSDSSAGVHIHVECNDFTPKQLAAVLRFAYKFEDALYRIASSGWEHMRSTRWCRPFPDQIALDAMRIREEADIARLWAGRLPNNRYYMVNVQKWTVQGTLEFRLFNSTLNPKRLQGYIALAVAIVNDARVGYSRSTAKHFPAGYMAAKRAETGNDKAEKAMILKLQQILCYQSGMTQDDWKIVRWIWNDSQNQQANIIAREDVRPLRVSTPTRTRRAAVRY